jgi:hypothetical protein
VLPVTNEKLLYFNSETLVVKTSKIIRAEIERIKKFFDETTAVDVDLYGELIRCRGYYSFQRQPGFILH